MSESLSCRRLRGIPVLVILSGMAPGFAEEAGQTLQSLDLTSYTLTPVYEADFSQPLKVVMESALFKDGKRVALPEGKDWALESATGRAWTENGRLCVSNRNEAGESSHAVLWNTHAFPGDFLLEFGFSPEDSNMGLAIVFFCARSRTGGSVFDLDLPARGADYKNYHHGALDCYHVSYWAIQAESGEPREDAHLRKSYGHVVVAYGKDLIAGQGPGPHRMRLLKAGGKIQLEVNGRMALEFQDDGKTYGPVLGDGCIGLRQMAHTGQALYTDFKVWKVEPKAQPCDYLGIVRAFADAMIERGRDVYGAVHSPLFAAALDRKTLRIFRDKPGELKEIRDGDRVWSGANPMHDQDLCQTLYALAKATGDPKYGAEADEAIQWFFANCQSPKGLMAWGEHQGWDFLAESSTAPDEPHEFYRPWVLWERSFDLAPQACQRFALGLWNHQIADHEKGLFSRHAMDIWDETKPSGRTGSEFPRHGGFYIAAWAEAYARSKEPVFLKAIETLVDSFEQRRDPVTGALPSQTDPDKAELTRPTGNLSLSIDLWDAAPKVPPELAEKMRAAAARNDENFLRLGHDLGPGGHGFVKAVITSSLEPGDVRAIKSGKTKGLRWTPFSYVWSTGYGAQTDARVAMNCLMRYRQVKLEGYKNLALAAADRYLATEPDLNDPELTLYPGAMAEAIALELNAYRVSGDPKYLQRADFFARKAVEIFFDAQSPLPKASSRNDHYEAITRADNLVMQLLDLWAVENKPDLELTLVWAER